MRLMKYELFRILHMKSFWLILSISSLFTVFSFFVDSKSIQIILSLPNSTYNDELINEYEKIVHFGYTGFINGANQVLILLIPLVISIIISAEAYKGTLINILSLGYSRTRVYVSKLLVSCLVTTFIYFCSTIIYGILASVEWGFSNSQFDWLRFFILIITKLLLFVGVCSVVVSISFIFNNKIISIIMSMAFFKILPVILSMFKTILNINYNFENFELASLISTNLDFSLSNLSIFLLISDKHCIFGFIQYNWYY